jgi:hypothetical protein
VNSLILAVVCFLLSEFLLPGVSYVRPRTDASGQVVLRPDGSPAWERDWPLELREQWAPYSCLGLSAFFIVRAAFIRFRPEKDCGQ